MTHISSHEEALHNPHKNADASPLIVLDNFCVALDGRAVLRHVDLSIYAGECVVLMGDNGSGKTSLLRALAGLIWADQGTYTFLGKAIDKKSMRAQALSKWLHQKLGFVFQDSDAQLFCASVEDEIAFGPRQMGLTEEDVSQRVTDVAKLLHIEDLIERAPYNLSGGEKKKVALATVLAINPDVYCLDEPMAGLDKKTQAWLLATLVDLKSAGKTIIISTHDQSLADELADWFVYVGDFHGYEDRPHVHINQS